MRGLNFDSVDVALEDLRDVFTEEQDHWRHSRYLDLLADNPAAVAAKFRALAAEMDQ